MHLHSSVSVSRVFYDKFIRFKSICTTQYIVTVMKQTLKCGWEFHNVVFLAYIEIHVIQTPEQRTRSKSWFQTPR